MVNNLQELLLDEDDRLHLDQIRQKERISLLYKNQINSLKKSDLISTIQTPVLVLDLNEVSRNLANFQKFLPEVNLFYAVKANTAPELLRFFYRKEMRFDVASVREFEILENLGVSPQAIMLSHPIKSQSLIDLLFLKSVGYYVVDNLTEMERIANTRDRLASEHQPKLFIRIRVDSHAQIDLNKKFGCFLPEAIALFKKAQTLNLFPYGVAFHVGSQCCVVDDYRQGFEKALTLFNLVKEECNWELKAIDIGGGFPDPLVAYHHKTSPEKILASVGELCHQIQQQGVEIFAEPGRGLVGSAGMLITRVIGISHRKGRRWVYLDDGVYGGYSGKIYDGQQHFIFLPISSDNDEKIDLISTVAGPTCDSFDVIDSTAFLSEKLEVGDRFFSVNLGAYSTASATEFNGFAPPSTFVLNASPIDELN